MWLIIYMSDAAVAQGIVAQARILGGSIGIAASAAILGVAQRRELGGTVSESQLASLQSAGPTLQPAQLQAIRRAHSNAFNESLRVCAIIAGACVLITLGTFQRHPLDIEERRKQQIMEEGQRQRAIMMKAAKKT